MYLGVCDWFSADSFDALPVPSWPGRGSSGRTLEISPARCARVDAFALARLVVGAGFLATAAAADVRTRRVRDPIWVALGTIGLVVLGLQLLSSFALVNDYFFLFSAAILFYAVFYGRPIVDEDGIHLRPVRLLVLAVSALSFVTALLIPFPILAISATGGYPDPFFELLSMPIMILVYQGFYQVGLLRGGADAKCLIALTVLVPIYPDLSPLPLIQASPAVSDAMRVVFPFSLVVLVDAAILMLVVPLAYLVVNVARREFEWPVGFLGTKVSIDSIPPHAWVMERIDDRGERYAVLFPSRDTDESAIIEKLRAAGSTRVWVEAKIPFILLLFLGFLLAFAVGNLILGALTGLLPAA